MSDEAFAAPTSSQTGAAMTPVSEGDYDAIFAAVMETVRGRWFLSEHSRRNRHADTELVLTALNRIEHGLRGRQTPESVERLRNDLMGMARAIARGKAEIAGVSPTDEGDPIGDVSQELDSVVRATEEATSNILAAAAQIQEVAWSMREQGNDVSLADQLSAYVATIETAASSQKLARERTQKVVDVMRDLEGRINDMIDVWGAYPAVDNRLLANSARNTPALPPADFVQAEIDAPTNVEPQRDATSHDLSSANPETNRPREPRYLNDNGRARSANGRLVLDPSIAAAIRDAASLTNTGVEGNATTPAHVPEATGPALPGTPPDEWSGDGKDAYPSKSLEPTGQRGIQELADTQSQDGSHDLKNVTEIELPEKSELEVAGPADVGGETIAPPRESASALEVLSEPVDQAEPAEVLAQNAEPNPTALDVGTKTAFRPDETTPSSVHAPAEVSLSSSSGAPSAEGAHPQAISKTAAEPDQQLEPLDKTQSDAFEKHDAQDVAAVEITAKPRPFVVIDLDLEPLPIGLDTQVPPSPPALDTGSADARGASGSARIPAEPKPSGWLSEPVSALYDLPPLEVTPAAGTTYDVKTSSGSAPDAPPARQSQSGSRWPFAFLAPRLRAKPTSTESTPTETTAPPPAVVAPAATNKIASAPATIAPAVAYELGGLVVVAPPVASEPRRPPVAAATEPPASEWSPAAVAPVATPAVSKPGAVAAPPETSKLDTSAVSPAAPVAPIPAPVVAAVAPTASEPPAPSVAAALPPPASEPVATVVATPPPAAASDPSGPVAAPGTSAKSATSSVKVLRPSPPPPSDPLAALAALSDEEKLALFS